MPAAIRVILVRAITRAILVRPITRARLTIRATLVQVTILAILAILATHAIPALLTTKVCLRNKTASSLSKRVAGGFAKALTPPALLQGGFRG